MAVIPSGNGTDPWTLLRDYVKGQDTDRRRHEDMNFRNDQLQQTLAQRDAMNSPEAQYAKTDARLKARIANGFGPRTGSGSAMTDKKSASEFEAGLREGGINNPYAIATLMGNAQAESKFNTGATGDLQLGPGREAHGAMQWRESRWQALQAFASAKGAPVTDPKTQGMFAAHELTSGPYSKIGAQLQQLKDINGAQPLMRQYLGYDTKVANEADRAAVSAAWLKRDQGIKTASADQPNARHYHDPNDPPYIYRTGPEADAARYQLTHMSDTAYGTALAGARRKYKKDADKTIVQDFDEPFSKTGAPAYRVYDRVPVIGSPAPVAAVPTAPVAVPVAPQAEPVTTGAIVPPIQQEPEVEEEEQPQVNPLDYLGD